MYSSKFPVNQEGRVWEGMSKTGNSVGAVILIILLINNNDSSTWPAEQETKHFAHIISCTAFI